MLDERNRLGVNVSAGTLLAQTGTVVFSNSNGFSFGMLASASSSVVTASGGAGAAIQSISAGTTRATSGEVAFSNSNGIEFGVNGQTVTARYKPLSYWDNLVPENAFRLQGSSSTVNLSLQRVSFGRALDATRADLIGHLTVVGSTAGSITISLGLYTMGGSTASTVSTASVAITWNSGTNSTAASIYGGQSGTRWRSIALGTWNITPGEYLLGVVGSISGVAGTTATFSAFGSQQISRISVSGGGDMTAYFANGFFSVGTAALPASVQLSDINQTILSAGATGSGQIYLQLAGTFS